MDSDSNIINFAIERRLRGPRFNGEMMQILEVSRDLVCLCRAGAITAINGAGVRMLGGKSTEDMIGRRLADFLIPEYCQVLDLFLAGMASEDRGVPTRIISLDGAAHDIELQVYRAREIAGDATVVTGRDLSKEGKLAGTARQTDIRFQLLVDNSMNLVCHVVDDVVRYINAAGVELLGAMEAEQIIGLPLSDIFHQDYAEMVKDIVDEQAMVPLRLKHKDGTVFDAQVRITQLPGGRGRGRELMVEARDITAHNRAVAALRRSNETLEMRVAGRTRELTEQRGRADELRGIADAARRFTESLIDTIPSPVWFKDALGRVQNSNRAFRALFGDSAGLAELMPSEDAVSDAELLAGGCERAAFEACILPPAGRRMDAMVLKTAYPDEDGRPVGVIGMLTDISERKSMERELRRLATIDPLTGAYNRRHFMAGLNTEMDRALRYGNPMTVAMLDVDHFKRINDAYGHGAGDEALKALVDVLRDSLRDIDVIGRMGGEEFAILMPETAAVAAADVAERLRRAVAELVIPLAEGGCFSFTSSFGLADPMGKDDTAEGVLLRADKALYAAKHQGRDRVCLYTSEDVDPA